MENSMNRDELIDHYLLNKLEGADRSQFEIEMMENLDLLKEVQLREALIDELQESATQIPALDSSATNNSVSITKGITPNVFQWIQQPLSIAASLVIVIGFFTLAPKQYSNDLQNATLSALTPLNSGVVLETMRGDSQVISIRNDVPISISISVGLLSTGTFNVAIIDEMTNNTVASLDSIALSEPGFIQLLLNKTLFGAHTVNVSAAGSEEFQSYSINFIE